MDKSCVRYEDDQAFRHAVEKESRDSVTDAEWSNLTRDSYPLYDGLDLAERVNAVRGEVSKPT